VPAANLYRLPSEFPLEVAPLAEPVACAVRGLDRLAPHPDEPAIVFGAGTMGLVLAILLELRGVGPVTVVDVNPVRRSLASLRCGAVVRADADGLRAPFVIEATGNPSAFGSALACLARARTLLVFGVAAPMAVAEISPYRIYADELTIVGSMAILRSFPAAIDTIGRHADRLAPLVTDRFALEHVDAALQTVADGRSVKTVLTR
jgi:threonine dehydrogenase-like Zn-dependent dehydrogenase